MALEPSLLGTADEFDFERILGGEPEPIPTPTPKTPDPTKPTLESLQAELATAQAAMEKFKGLDGLDPDDLRLAIANTRAQINRPTPEPRTEENRTGLESLTPEQMQSLIESTDQQMKTGSPSKVMYGALAQVVTSLRQEMRDLNASSPVGAQVAEAAMRDFKKEASSDPYTGKLFQAGEKRFDELMSQYDPRVLATATPAQLTATRQACREAAIGYASTLSVRSAMEKRGKAVIPGRVAPHLSGRSTGDSSGSDSQMAQLITILGKGSHLTDDEIAELIAED
jgi:hypothetical protein